MNCGGALSGGDAGDTPPGLQRSELTVAARARQFKPVSTVSRALTEVRSSLGILLDRYDSRPPRVVEIALVATFAIIALAVRVWNLGEIPYGMHGDELVLASDAQRFLDGDRLDTWVWAKAMIYVGWMALILRIGDTDIATIRLASATMGAAIIPVGYLLVRSLFPFRVAILSAAMLTVSFWFVLQSRIAFPMVCAILFGTLAMYLSVSAVRHRRWWLAALAGVVLGLGLYTYKLFLIYLVGFWGASILAVIIYPELRRQKYIWIILSVSVLVSLRLLTHYVTDFDRVVLENLRVEYGRGSALSPEGWLEVPGLILHAILLVNNPVSGGSIDAAPRVPIVSLVPAVFFWLGLAIAVIFIKRGRYQLLLAGWLIGMLPILVVPGSEGRRYLFGIFFVLVIVSIGFNAILSLLIYTMRREAPSRIKPEIARRIGYGAAVALAAVFISIFTLTSFLDFNYWRNSGELRWFFSQDSIRAFEFIETLGDGSEIRYYSVRLPFNSRERRLVAPDAVGIDGGEHHGGDGTIWSGGPLGGNTVFVFLDEYLTLAAELEAAYPGARQVAEHIKDNETVYLAYLIPFPASGDGIVPRAP
ncbi:MAG: glycosyltransferase family 39 protein [Dehalococcoidia bacterium]|nr:glycosyltransferase family 39 protein [Dehalococcoidia bacterium]